MSQEDRDQNKDSVTPFRICKLFSAAYNKAATMEISMNGFKKTGLFPCNRDIFQDYDFPVMNNEESENAPRVAPAPALPTDEPSPGSSRIILPSDITPVPRRNFKRTSNRKGGSACILNSPNYTKTLQESLENASKRKKMTENSSGNVKKKLFSNNGKGTKNGNGKGKGRGRPKKKVEESESSEPDCESDASDEINNADCLFCGGNYKEDKNGESWVQYIVCFQWGHEECGASGASFTCPTCKRKIKFM